MKKETVQAAISVAKEERPIAELVQLANQFESSIYIEVENRTINAKSIMGMMTLNLMSGLQLKVSADGSDEEEAIRKIQAFVTGK
ncbi:MAG: HPr family phosphocarrier protein [Lachnospiraceae bacterium]|nr:HPr family phosphocarrier protein [Lachnospiraceae bacterium]